MIYNSFNNFIFESLKKIPVLFFTPKPLATITYIRVFIFSFFLYKLLSRDYRIFSFASFRVLGIDSSEVYKSYLDYAALSNHILTDILTFHWIHWFVPFPSFQTLSFIYFSTIVFCIVVIIFGRGPKNLYCIISFIFLTYLGLKHEQRNKSPGEKERERYSPEEIEARSKQRYEDEKILEEEYKKKNKM